MRTRALPREDIELAARALAPAAHRRLHVFLATSAIHRQYKLNMAQEEILRLAAAGVSRARELCEDVEFSPEDASRTELEFLAQVVEVAIAAGATTVNIPDTVGYTVPDEFAELFRYLRKNVRGIERVRLSVHCHDDLGMAVANSLTAVVAGARQIECTINGIGERAGNCSLEEVVMALKTRAAFFNVATGVNTNRLYPTSRLVSSITGQPIPRNKAVVGENAFAHEAGIHQHGMLKHFSTYEIMRPEDVGLARSSLVLGKHSGRHAFRERVETLGFELDETEFNRVFEEFKALADKKKELFDGDIESLVLRAEGAALPVPGSSSSSPPRPAAGTSRAPPSSFVTAMAAAPSVPPAGTARSMPRSRRSKPLPASRSHCASSRCTPFPKARTPRARRACTWSTMAAATGAPA